jgi:GTP-binding protein HflX
MNFKKKSRVVLAGLQLANTKDFEHKSSMDELERLVTTLGFTTLERFSQKRKLPHSGYLFGKGKLKEIANWTGGTGEVYGFNQDPEDEIDENGLFYETEREESEMATMVVVDSELTPTQLTNLEKAFDVEVLDRTAVILEIFSRHANTKEARLQVEIAKLAYMAPRLRASRVGGDRQGGGIGSKGSGETSHELDRRRIRDRIADLRGQLKAIRVEELNRRSHRDEVSLVALIGYTNAGKSSLMRKLTKTEIEGENKLFATLGTTIRVLQPETTPKILVSDTVGFIKKLPHDLVASFRSTLDEAKAASLLLYVVDGSDANFRSQLEVTREVIADIGADENSSKLLINKSDLISVEDKEEIAKEYPEAMFISTQDSEDINVVRELIRSEFEKDMSDKEVFVPYTSGHIIGKIRTKARVLTENYLDDGTMLLVRAEEDVHKWISKLL